MKAEDFILKIEDEFEDLEKGKLKPESNFREFFDWNSINALIFIALVDSEYDVTITPDDIRNSETIMDLFNTIIAKKSS
ncbi:MAG: acyl carrier protein [Bacteroidales bacterium]|nr:acyl carrier protein [Bacteroidales bacterium]